MIIRDWNRVTNSVIHRSLFFFLFLLYVSVAPANPEPNSFRSSNDIDSAYEVLTPDVWQKTYEFLASNNESLASISFGISGDLIHPLSDGVIVRIISDRDYDGFYGSAVIVRSQSTYYYDKRQTFQSFDTMYANIDVAQNLSVWDQVTTDTVLGTMTQKVLPYDSTGDVKIVLHTYRPDHHEVVMENGGAVGTTLPGVDNVYFHNGMFLLRSSMSLLDFIPIDSLYEISWLLHQADAHASDFDSQRSTFSYGFVHFFRLPFMRDNNAHSIASGSTLESFINYAFRSTSPPIIGHDNVCIQYPIGDHFINIVHSRDLYERLRDDVNAGEKYWGFIQSMGFFRNEEREIEYVFQMRAISEYSPEEFLDAILY